MKPETRNQKAEAQARIRRGILLVSAFWFLAFSGCTTFLTPRSQQASSTAVVIPNVPVLKWGIESCGAGSLSTVLQHYGDTTSMQAWDAALPKVHGGVMTVDLLIAAQKKGFDAQIITADRDTVRGQIASGHPVILMLKVIDSLGHAYDFFHYIVIDGVDPASGLIRAQFGDNRARWVSFDRLENAWAGGGHTAIIITPHDAVADSLRAAVALEDEGKYSEAADRYRQIVASHPDSFVAWTNLGNAEMQLKDNAAAEKAFRQALAIAPASRDALNNLSWLLFQENRLPEAEELARKAVAQPGPDSYLILDTLGRILAARGNCAESASTFREAIASVPSSRPDAKRDLENAMAAAQGTCKS